MPLLTDARLVSRGLLTAVRRPDAPWKLTIAVTWVCDQRCTHCRIWRRPRSDELDAGEWRRVFRGLGARLSWVDLTGGEVTSREDFVEIATAAVEECPELTLLHFPTNGRRPDAVESTHRGVLAAGPRRVILSVSLDGPPALHDRLRGDPGAFENAVETYRRVRALGVEVYFGMTLSEYNAGEVAATLAALQTELPGLTIRDLHANLLHISPHYFQNEAVTERRAPDAVSEAIARVVAERGPPRHPTHLLEHLFLRRIPEYLATGRSPLPCASLSANAFIDPAGTVYPCHVWDRPLAALREHDFDLRRIWSLPVVLDARADVVAERCPGCWTPCEAYPTVLANLVHAALPLA